MRANDILTEQQLCQIGRGFCAASATARFVAMEASDGMGAFEGGRRDGVRFLYGPADFLTRGGLDWRISNPRGQPPVGFIG